MNPLTDEAFRDPDLFCSYSTPHCETCSFCKYSMVRLKADDGFCTLLIRLDRKLAHLSRITMTGTVPRLRRPPVLGIVAMLEAPFLLPHRLFRYVTL